MSLKDKLANKAVSVGAHAAEAAAERAQQTAQSAATRYRGLRELFKEEDGPVTIENLLAAMVDTGRDTICRLATATCGGKGVGFVRIPGGALRGGKRADSNLWGAFIRSGLVLGGYRVLVDEAAEPVVSADRGRSRGFEWSGWRAGFGWRQAESAVGSMAVVVVDKLPQNML